MPERPEAASYDEDYFRQLYGDVPAQTRFDRGRDGRVARLVRAHAPALRPGAAILDVGCGFGFLLERFADRYRRFGVELSLHAGLRARAAGAQVVQGDVQDRLPFGPSFDVVTAINVIEHLPDPEAGVRGLRAVLRPGGLCVIHLPTISGPVSRLLYRFFYAGDPTHVYRPSGRAVRALFESAGFRLLEGSHAPHVPGWLWRRITWNPAYLAAFRLEEPAPLLG